MRAGEGNRTPICGLGSHRLNHWTTPAGRVDITRTGPAGATLETVRIVLALLLLALALAPPALAAEPKTTLPDVEDEVMCVECGTALNVSSSPVADQEREFIRRRIAEGKSKAEIKAALVEEYGARVLAMPEGGGFDVAAWLVPGRPVPRRAARRRRRGAALAAAARRRARRRRGRPRARSRRRPPPRRRPRRLRPMSERRRHHRPGRVRGRLRLVHLAVRAAARARLPVGRVRRLADRDPRGRPAAEAHPAARARRSACRSRSSSWRSA